MTDITGRDDFVIAKALYLAVNHIDSLPPEEQPLSDQEDMQRILNEKYPKYEALFLGIDIRRSAD